MPPYTAPPPHRAELPVRTPVRGRTVPRGRNRICALVSLAGLALALLSLYLPWLASGSAPGGALSAIGITDTIDVRSIAPVLFLGLVAVTALVVATAVTRLGVVAAAASAIALVALAAHVAFVLILYTSTGAADPTLSGLPSDATVTYGPYVAALGFALTAAGSAWAAASARDGDRPPGRRGRRG